MSEEVKEIALRLWEKNKIEFDSNDCNKENFEKDMQSSGQILEKNIILLEPWISLFDEALYWLHLLHELTEKINDKQEKQDVVSFVMLSHKLFRDANSIRILILHGYQDTARIIFRSFLENMELFIVLMCNKDLSIEYGKFEDSKAFFHKHLSKGKIEKKMKVILKKIEPEEEGDITVSRFKDLKSFLSDYVHSSPQAGFASTFEPSLERPGFFVGGKFGRISAHAPQLLFTFFQSAVYLGYSVISIIIRNMTYIEMRDHIYK